MKIAVISDLHIDINEKFPVIDCLASYLKKHRADVLLVAGDICENAVYVKEAMEELEKQSGSRVLYVPGNHDMWSEHLEEVSTDEIYQIYKEDPRCLCDHPIVLKGENGPFVVIGDIGWYDYSFASKEYGFEELETMEHEGRIWQDRLKNQWTVDNKGCLEQMLNHLEKQLKEYIDYPAVVVTHMLPIKEFCVPEEREMWKFFNAFLGSEELEKLYNQYHVAYAVCGHVHYRKALKKEDTMYLCPCLGYHTEWEQAQQGNEGHGEDLEWQIEHSVQWIDM